MNSGNKCILHQFNLLLICSLLLLTFFSEVNPTMANERTENVENKRKVFAQKLFKDYPESFAPEIQDKILAQQVVLGMAPYEAHLAAGAFFFKVEAGSKWSKNTDPYKVMWAQSQSPDDSEIWMTFETATQYPAEGLTRFKVHFQNGRAVEILKLGKENATNEQR